MDRATDCCPSKVQDWLYCCEPSSTRGILVKGCTVTTSRRRTMPVAGGVGPVEFIKLAAALTAPAMLGPLMADDALAAAWVICPVEVPVELPVELPVAVLTMMSANSSALV